MNTFIGLLGVTLFEIKSNPQLDKRHFTFNNASEYPYFTRTEKNNGILGYVDYLDDEHKIKGNSLAIGMIGMRFFYMDHDFYAGQFTKTAFPKFDGFDKTIALFFITAMNKYKDVFQRVLVGDFEETFNNSIIEVPYINGQIAFEYIKSFIKEVQIIRVKRLMGEYQSNLKQIMEISGLTSEDIGEL